jgi:hypothetical protein
MTNQNNSQNIQEAINVRVLVASGRVRFGLFLTTLGFIVFVIGAKPEWLNLDRSPVVGFVQIAVFLVGLAIISIGGYVGLTALWHGDEKSILAEIGMRLVSTGYVIAVFAGMADVFGLGSHPLPGVPFFGHLQSIGVQLGEAIIAAGFLLLIPYHSHIKTPPLQ